VTSLFDLDFRRANSLSQN